MSEFKLHHHVSELVTFLGISPTAAEQYTETLKAFVKRFDKTKASTSSAVLSLSEKSENPQAFLHKYEELKSRNIRDLDSLVVILSSIQKDSDVKNLVEEVSKQKYEEEGYSIVPVPEIVKDLREASETVLSRDELEKLRERILRESQVIHMPSEALQAVEWNDKKTANLGPEVPEWLSNRPFLSLDFVKREPRQGEGGGALNEVPCASQEHQLIEDILSLMMGIEGIYITVVPATNSYDPPDFILDPSVDRSLGQFVTRILPLCGFYSQLARFIEDKSQYHHGLVNQALAAAISTLLKDYVLLITQLEEKHRQWDLTLHKLFFYVEKTMGVMEMLACITKVISKSGASGGAVLSLLHDRTLSLMGCGHLQNVMVFLTQTSAEPFMSMLSKWLLRGIISDPYNEFMVVDRESGNEEVEDVTDDYWERRYSIIPQNVPTFLKSHDNVILRTGKYLNVIRQSGQSVENPEQQKLSYSFTDVSYADVIDRMYNFTSKRLLELLMKEKDLMGRLRSVKHYFLLDQGDFVVQLMSLCEDELRKNIDDVLPNRLESLLELALRTSAANNDLYKDDIFCELQPITLMNQMLRILSIETEDEQDFYLQEDRLQLSGLQGFSLGYKVTWPVSLVLDRRSITCYQMIFRHLFFCKHVENMLCRVWVSNKVTKSFPLSASRTYSSAFALRQRMLNFIQNIEYYMMFEVIERNWQTFIGKMQKVENVDEVLVFHNDFLNGVLKDCMLTSPELLRIISKLTGICVSFANFIEESPEPASSTHEDSQSFEQTISKFELQFSGMIFTLMEKIYEQGREHYSDPLVNVIYRLDFNMYYAKRHEHLRMATSPEASMEYISGPPSD